MIRHAVSFTILATIVWAGALLAHAAVRDPAAAARCRSAVGQSVIVRGGHSEVCPENIWPFVYAAAAPALHSDK